VCAGKGNIILLFAINVQDFILYIALLKNKLPMWHAINILRILSCNVQVIKSVRRSFYILESFDHLPFLVFIIIYWAIRPL
jgi:hypothetical protein